MGGVPGSQRAYDMMGAPIRITRLRTQSADATVVPLVPPRGIYDPRVMAVFMGLGALVAGLATFVFFWVIELAFSIWGSKTTNLPEIAGLTVAAIGIAFAVAYGVIETRNGSPRFAVGEDHMVVFLPELKGPLVVARSQVRVVAVDDQPTIYFKDNKRFPITGPLPPEIFADAVDRGSHPWDPGEPQPRIPRDPAIAPDGRETMPWEVAPGVPSEPVAPPNPGEHQPGWATVGSRPPPPPRGIRGYLFTAHGSALPVFTYNPADIPNLAVLFTHPLRIRSGLVAKIPVRLRGSRMPNRGTNAGQIRGLLVKAQFAQRAAETFGRWGVVRDITSDDVLDAGLRPPKPLKGLRLAAYAVTMLAPLILKIILRNRW